MSYIGKMNRGKALYGYRDIDGNLPSDITSDTHKMEEVNFYLNESKPKAKPKTTEKSVTKEEPKESVKKTE